MKKIVFVVVTALVATASFSQVKYGIQVMGNAGFANIKVEDVDDAKSKMKIGMGAGLVADYGVSEHFGVRTSLNWLQKNAKMEYEDPYFQGKPFSVTSTLNYIELPVYALYKKQMTNATFFAGAGPSFGYGFSGKLKVKGYVEVGGEGDEIITMPFEAKVDAFKKESEDGGDLKRFDISVTAIAGVSFNNGLFVHASYLHGFTNLVKEEGTYRNRGALLTVGFMLP